MEQLNKFISLLTGRFHNSEQYETMKKNGIEFPFAEHVNTVCNDKIRNLPPAFKGVFMLKKLTIHRTEKRTHHPTCFYLPRELTE